eukprot:TRINITY_DN20056_c0_g1_i1.p1 TRINITY_DN20056_c0_g1~~TRINITY_DN20056_c0_g1_i1.p1  ORF type:complete len:502 (-),score=94.56 TRINITY_DN20056_c0_g1_i1:6-1472(-)
MSCGCDTLTAASDPTPSAFSGGLPRAEAGKLGSDVPPIPLGKLTNSASSDFYPSALASSRSTGRLSRPASLGRLASIQEMQTSGAARGMRTSRGMWPSSGRKASELRFAVAEARCLQDCQPREPGRFCIPRSTWQEGGGGYALQPSAPPASSLAGGELQEEKASVSDLMTQQALCGAPLPSAVVSARRGGYLSASPARSRSLPRLAAVEEPEPELCQLQRLLLEDAFQRTIEAKDRHTLLNSCAELRWLAECASRCPLAAGWSKVEGKRLSYMFEGTDKEYERPPCFEHFVKMAWCVLRVHMERASAASMAALVDGVAVDALASAKRLSALWSGPHADISSGQDYFHCASAGISSWQHPTAEPMYVALVAERLLQADVLKPSSVCVLPEQKSNAWATAEQCLGSARSTAVASETSSESIDVSDAASRMAEEDIIGAFLSKQTGAPLQFTFDGESCGAQQHVYVEVAPPEYRLCSQPAAPSGAPPLLIP